MTKASVEIRRATPADAGRMAEVWLASFKATYSFPLAHSDDEVRAWIASDLSRRDETFVAVEPDRDRVIALMSLKDNDLDQLYVDPAWLGRGIGSRLVELAKERRRDGFGLYTFQVNDRARRFYERHGLVATWFGDGSANEERQPDLRYEWRPRRDAG
ncbi:MAG TPA: GNAT family N-acetyltransferase [Candidatus Limnocylindrales bacterium]|nr:GNAT family N-acetyltransferase [Candidatus Limnocylindrales bacterium]